MAWHMLPSTVLEPLLSGCWSHLQPTLQHRYMYLPHLADTSPHGKSFMCPSPSLSHTIFYATVFQLFIVCASNPCGAIRNQRVGMTSYSHLFCLPFSSLYKASAVFLIFFSQDILHSLHYPALPSQYSCPQILQLTLLKDYFPLLRSTLPGPNFPFCSLFSFSRAGSIQFSAI